MKSLQYIVVFLIIFLCIHGALAVSNRAFEPVIMKGEQIGEFVGAYLENVVAYSFNAATAKWSQAAIQIDDRWSSGNIAFADRDSVLQTYDDVLFLAKDFRDIAPSTEWIADESSKKYQRIQITATDPVSGTTGYLYVFKTDDPSLHADAIDYVDYSYDKISGYFYDLDHTNTEGIMSSMLVKSTMDGNGLDIVDRLKLRMKAWYDTGFPFGWVTLMAGEPQLHKVRTTVMDGPIRVTRKWRIDFVLPGVLGNINLPEKDWLVRYYPTSCNMGSLDQLSINGFEFDYIRVSVDLNSNANGMKFYKHDETDGVLINRAMDSDDNNLSRSLAVPGWNWWMQTGTPGTLLSVAELPDVANTTETLYYRDAVSGEDDSPFSGDDVYDTGTDGSWGDAGIKYYSTSRKTQIPSAKLWFHFLGPNISPDSAETIMSFHEAPLGLDDFDFQGQEYVDAIPPAAIVDLHITKVSDNSVTLAWSAPGDDGDGNGAATQYQLRYMTIEPNNRMIGRWWLYATVVATVPYPGNPGEVQSISVSGLDPNQQYYFVMRTVDDEGNLSGYSNYASDVTTPVELAALTARQVKKTIQLDWTTATETNNLGFKIEKKTQDMLWLEIGFVQGNGTRSVASHYTFLDNDVSATGDVYYRLKQIDTDGSFHYSPEVMVNVNAPKSLTLFANYPNPFNPSTRISYQIPEHVTGQLEIVIYDVLGRKIRTLVEAKAQAGYYQVEWDGKNDFGNGTGSGEYFCVLRVGSLQHIQKMIKLH